jgi:predicted anti-sigma-YlaC factor YlaD
MRCARAREHLDPYVEAELAGVLPDRSLTAHLRVCPACRTDHDGLLALLERTEDELGGERLMSAFDPGHAAIEVVNESAD